MAEYTITKAKAGKRLSLKMAETDSKDIDSSESFSAGSMAVVLSAVHVKLASTDRTRHIGVYDNKGNLVAQYSPSDGTEVSKLP